MNQIIDAQALKKKHNIPQIRSLDLKTKNKCNLRLADRTRDKIIFIRTGLDQHKAG